MTDVRVLANALGWIGDVPSTLPLSMHPEALLPFSLERGCVWGGVRSLCCLGSAGMHINPSVWRVAQTHCPFIPSLCGPFLSRK